MTTVPATSVEYQGCRLAFDIRGQGIPVVFIQGVGVHGDGWRPQVDALAHSCRCLTFDNRGMARSQPTPSPQKPSPGALSYGAPITVEQMTLDTLAIMDAAGMHAAHIVGHSLGGLVALHLALTARPRVQSLALLCTFPAGCVATRLSWRMLWLGTRSRIGPRSWRRNAFLQIVMPPDCLRHANKPKLAADLAPLFGHDLADLPPIVPHQLRALKRYNATPRLAELAGIPTLILSAAHDPIATPALCGQVLAKYISGSKYVEFPNASHGLPIQSPQEVNEQLLAHLQQKSS